MNNLDTDHRANDLRNLYHDRLRGLADSVVHPSERIERTGPIVRKTPTYGRGSITYRDLGGMDGEELNTFIAQQIAHFRRAGIGVEWKYHHDDSPDDLPRRLRAAGFTPAADETVMVTEAIDVAIASRLPAGVEIREIGTEADLERLRGFHERVWDREFAWLPKTLRTELLHSPTPPLVLLAESDGEVVAGGWMRFQPGTEFASLWGGTTAPHRRGEGIYRALVAHRAQQALRHGYRYMWADCASDSAAALRRLGAAAVAIMTPYVWG